MKIFKEFRYKHLAKKLKKKRYHLYEAIIQYNDGTEEIITRNRYTYGSKYNFVHYGILQNDKMFYQKEDDTYIPIQNIKEIKVKVKDEQYVWYIDFESLEDMTLEEIVEWNNDS